MKDSYQNKKCSWFAQVAQVWRNEFRIVFKDFGVLIFFIGLPLFYPIVYTLIYNPEVLHDIPVAVVDNSRSAESRDFVRKIDATPAIGVIGYAADMTQAREWLNEKGCYGILEIPSDYAQRIGRGEQATVPFYSDMSLLLRYRSFISALTDVQLATGAEIRQTLLDEAGLGGASTPATVDNQAFFLGDTEQGFASFVIPGIVVLILQQSLLLGVAMLAGTAAERRRKNGGIDPLAPNVSASATVIGKMLCYVVIYLPMMFYILHFIPLMFSLPHIGSTLQAMLFILPMIIGASFLGMLTGLIVKEREMSLMVVVFTSVVLLFLSGLTWPRYAMSTFWQWVGNAVPAVWGMEGFIRINSNGSTLADNSQAFFAMWILAVIYFIGAWILFRVRARRRDKIAARVADND